MRVVLGIAYRGQAYMGWQSQPHGRTVQDQLERAIERFANQPLRTICAGRTDSGVHALNQVVHFDASIDRVEQSWVRGCNRFLPSDIAIQWCRLFNDDNDNPFHARKSALGRRYVYLLLESPVRPAIEEGHAGWSFRPLNGDAMRSAIPLLIGEHDFSAFRSSECQAASPVKTLRAIDISRHGAYWRFSFDASAFLHHMVRNLMGCLVAIGAGLRDSGWLLKVLDSRDRSLAAPTFAADGLYFEGPYYDSKHDLPTNNAARHWLPGGDGIPSS